MSKPSAGEMQQVSELMAGELDGDARALAESVYGTQTPGAQALSDNEYTALVSRNWDDPNWRLQAAQSNPGAFLKAARQLGGVLPGEPGHSQTVPAQPLPPAAGPGA